MRKSREAQPLHAPPAWSNDNVLHFQLSDVCQGILYCARPSGLDNDVVLGCALVHTFDPKSEDYVLRSQHETCFLIQLCSISHPRRVFASSQQGSLSFGSACVCVCVCAFAYAAEVSPIFL